MALHSFRIKLCSVKCIVQCNTVPCSAPHSTLPYYIHEFQCISVKYSEVGYAAVMLIGASIMWQLSGCGGIDNLRFPPNCVNLMIFVCFKHTTVSEAAG